MRWTWLCLVPLCAAATAQDLSSGFGQAVKTAKAAQTQDQGQPLPPPSRTTGKELKVLSAEDWRVDKNKIYLEGGVHITYEGYDIKADRVEGDTDTQVFYLSGHGHLTGHDADIKGEEIEVDFKRKVFRFRQSSAVLGPEQTGEQVKGNVIVEGDGGLGTSRNIIIKNGGITFCDRPSPHFMLKAGTTEIIPGRRAKLRDVRLQILGKTVLAIPYLVVPLSQNSERYVPEIGQSPDEGLYAKFTFGTPLRGGNYLDHKLDLMQKLGVGLGTDLVYDRSNMSGRLSAYGLIGPVGSSRFLVDHRQNLGAGTLTVGAQYQRSNYQTAPNSTTMNTRAQYVLPWGGGTSRLSYNRNSTETTGYNSVYQSWNFSDSRRFGVTTTQIDLNYNSQQFNSQTTSKSDRFDVRFSAQSKLGSLNADLLFQKAVSLGDSSNLYRGSDRTPLLTLKTTSELLFGKRQRAPVNPDEPKTKPKKSFTEIYPFNAQFSIGELVDAGTQDTVTRINFDVDSRRNFWTGSPIQLTLGGRFVQGMYSDDTAQYTLNYDGRLTWKFTKDSSANLSYRRLQSFGYTPLSMDRTGSTDGLSADITHRAGKKFQLSMNTGYDILQGQRGQTPWQTVMFRTEFTPSQSFRARASTSYDTFSKLWSGFQVDTDFSALGASWVAGIRYDGRREQFAGMNFLVQGLKFGKITTSALIDFNGYTKMIESTHLSFAYDLHCTEAVLEITDNKLGFRNGRTIAFYFRIKALPTFSPFGTGRRGQAVGSGGGFGF